MAEKEKLKGAILQLRVEIVGIEPPIWRTVEVPEAMTLAGFHSVLQTLMDWHDAHLWIFEANGRCYQAPDPEFEPSDQPSGDPKTTCLREVLPTKGAALLYTYDMGDNWDVDVRLLDASPPVDGLRYPHCLAGARCGPLEDCGGIPGYEELIEARRNPKRRGARELLKWAGKGWDPEAFDLAALNKALAGQPVPRRLQ